MKKLFAIVALIATLFVTEKAQAQLSINLGYAPETFVTSYDNLSTTANYQGFYGGFTYSVGIIENLDVSFGLQFRMNLRNENSTILGKTNKSQYLLDLPVLLNYDFGLNDHFSIIPFVGPMLSFAVAGNTKATIGNITNVAKWYGENSTLNPFNLNIVGGVGFAYNDFMLHAGYRFGLIDQDKSNYTTKTRGFFVGLSYEF